MYHHFVVGKDDQLLLVCLDIFIAGAQTTSSTLDFLFLVMILYPDIQKKVHYSIDNAFQKNESISYQDRQRVSFIEAVILEVERYYAVVPINGPRRVLRDTELEGYHIPKDTTVLISLHSVHFDKDYWKDPEVFRPERFLDNEGNIHNKERVLTFGLGHRRCLGEILAKHAIFLIFVEVMRKYTISLWPGTKQPTGIPVPGITITPEIYRAQFTPR
ncbi:unnamed protein product [Acanthoscelides obtectus]|uniref:Cytochrome P450 n=1 Tax=Acanthoscelides obtectus TaxID=200917 RepID=A0A9P0JK85_ACAOB|nr:unnamed protein product [Acanthoscelides obtectus]CAK1657938.1 Probable cytochrome P450 305a1 [Acanthoscelides obtectus]